MAMIEAQAPVEMDIIRQAQSGSQAAYGELYQRHFSAIQRYIYKRVDGSCDAEDLAQTVFLKAWQALRDYQPRTTPFRAWLYRIAHNTVIDHYRGQRNTLAWDDLDLPSDPRHAPEMIVLDQEQQETMHRAIGRLRPAYQEIIVHRFLRDMDYTEMAAELGHQVNNLRVLQHRALDALRRVLAQEVTLGIAVALTLLLLGRYTVVEAAQALPGDSLYPLRTVVEETSLFLADDATAIRLHTDFAAQRIIELRKLFQRGRMQDMAAATSNFATHIKAASTHLAIVTQSQPQASHLLTDQFKQALQQQAAELVDLTAAAPPTVRPAIQPALTVLVAAQTSLREQEDHPSGKSAEPAKRDSDSVPAQATPAQAGRNRHEAEPTVAPIKTNRGGNGRGQLTSIVTDAPKAEETPKQSGDDHAINATHGSSPNGSSSNQGAQNQVKATNVAEEPTRAVAAVATQDNQGKGSASTVQQSGKIAQPAANVPTPTPTNQPAPTVAAASVAPDNTQDHKAPDHKTDHKDAAPAPDKQPAAPEHAQQSKQDQGGGSDSHSDHSEGKSDSHKDH